MNRIAIYALASCMLIGASGCCNQSSQSDNAVPKSSDPVVCIDTSMGKIYVKLYAEKAPVTVENFLTYVNDGFYDGTIFHRVIKDFMIQGGGHNKDMTLKPTRPPIINEASMELKHVRGTITMARASDPDSATSQFTINHVDNPRLNFDGPYAPGYVVFGEVIEGMDVVDAIAEVETTRVGRYNDVPVLPVEILSVSVVEKSE